MYDKYKLNIVNLKRIKLCEKTNLSCVRKNFKLRTKFYVEEKF